MDILIKRNYLQRRYLLMANTVKYKTFYAFLYGFALPTVGMNQETFVVSLSYHVDWMFSFTGILKHIFEVHVITEKNVVGVIGLWIY